MYVLYYDSLDLFIIFFVEKIISVSFDWNFGRITDKCCQYIILDILI